MPLASPSSVPIILPPIQEHGVSIESLESPRTTVSSFESANSLSASIPLIVALPLSFPSPHGIESIGEGNGVTDDSDTEMSGQFWDSGSASEYSSDEFEDIPPFPLTREVHFVPDPEKEAELES